MSKETAPGEQPSRIALSTRAWLDSLGLARYATNFQSHSTVADLACSVFPEGTDIAAAENILRVRYWVRAAGPRSKLVSALRQWAPVRQSSPTQTVNKLTVEPKVEDQLQLQTSGASSKSSQQTNKRGRSAVQTSSKSVTSSANKRVKSSACKMEPGGSSASDSPNSGNTTQVNLTKEEQRTNKTQWRFFEPGNFPSESPQPKFNWRQFLPPSDKPKPRKVHADCSRVPGTGFVVDSFKVHPDVNDAAQHFLTHAFSVKGLRNDSLPDGSKVLCSATTAELAEIMYGLEPEQLRILPMGEPVDIPCTSGPGRGATVWQYDANHCAGGVMLLFRVWTSNEWVLHCGRFRFDVDRFMGHKELSRVVKERLLGSVYLDARYFYKYVKFDVPKPEQVLAELSRAVAEENERSGGRALFFCGSSRLGRDSLISTVVKALGNDDLLHANSQKRDVFRACNLDEEFMNRITDDVTKARVFVVPLWKLFKKSPRQLIQEDGTMSERLDFGTAVYISSLKHYKPGMEAVRRICRGKNIVDLKVAYFEYCGLTELKQFVKWAGPKRILPTRRFETEDERNELFDLVGPNLT